MIRILISKGNKVEGSMEVPYKKGFIKIICEWLTKDIIKINNENDRKK